jgi:DNA uptake protein ComE-like DNA-binding protein
MNRKKLFTSLVLLSLIFLVACSSAASSTTGGKDELPTQAVSVPSAGSKVNLNTASGDDFLAAIPELGNRMVQEFMEYRPYISIQQFRREIGKYVDEAQVAQYEQYVYVPIAINDSDSQTLQQIPGLSAEEANALMTARPFASTDAFLAKLAEYVSAEELEIAKIYLGGAG